MGWIYLDNISLWAKNKRINIQTKIINRLMGKLFSNRQNKINKWNKTCRYKLISELNKALNFWIRLRRHTI